NSPRCAHRSPYAKLLDGLQVGRGFAALTVLFELERHLLAIGQAAHASALNSGNVDEHVLAAAFRRDEAEALGGVEKLNGTRGHDRSPDGLAARPGTIPDRLELEGKRQNIRREREGPMRDATKNDAGDVSAL